MGVGGSRGADWWADVIPQTSLRRGSPVALKGLHCSSSSSHKSVLGELPWLKTLHFHYRGPSFHPWLGNKVLNDVWWAHALQKYILGRTSKGY